MIKTVGLKKHFSTGKGAFPSGGECVYAVNGVDILINDKETLGLVGESGSGKSTLGRLILRLLEPTAGSIYIDDKDLGNMGKSELKQMRKDMQIVFQDPYSALDDKMTVENILQEPLLVHKITSSLEYKNEISRLLEMVELSNRDMKKYPREFSQGQRQRISIARALATKPKFVVCDEPVSALDVSIQSGMLNLFMDIKEKHGLSYLFISHDLGMIRHVSDRVAVMYLGVIVEEGKCEDVFVHPMHPYTIALISSSLIPKPGVDFKRIKLKGDIPTAAEMPKGCVFNERCPNRQGICSTTKPKQIISKDGHRVVCHLYGRGAE